MSCFVRAQCTVPNWNSNMSNESIKNWPSSGMELFSSEWTHHSRVLEYANFFLQKKKNNGNCHPHNAYRIYITISVIIWISISQTMQNIQYGTVSSTRKWIWAFWIKKKSSMSCPPMTADADWHHTRTDYLSLAGCQWGGEKEGHSHQQ